MSNEPARRGAYALPSPRLRVSFAWYDLWVGAYVDRPNRTLYVCPLPTLLVTLRLWSGVHPRLRQPKDWQPPFAPQNGEPVCCCPGCYDCPLHGSVGAT